MDVFVGNLPDTITANVLEKLLSPFDRAVQIKLHRHQDKDGLAGCYAVCTFSSPRPAHKAIKKLNGYTLFSRMLTVREYFYRSYSNERRALGWRDRPWQGVERRGVERRRGTTLSRKADMFLEESAPAPVEQEEKERIVISGYRDLATKFT